MCGHRVLNFSSVFVVLEADLQLMNGFVDGTNCFHAMTAKVVGGVLQVFFGSPQRCQRLSYARVLFWRSWCGSSGLCELELEQNEHGKTADGAQQFRPVSTRAPPFLVAILATG